MNSVDISVLRSFAFHRADPRSNASRDALHQWIAEISLNDLAGPSTLDEIATRSQKSLTLPNPMPLLCIQKGVDLGVRLGTIQPAGDRRYMLTEDRRASLRMADEQLTVARDAFLSHIAQEVGKALGRELRPETVRQLLDMIEQLLMQLFSDNAEEVAHLISDKNGELVCLKDLADKGLASDVSLDMTLNAVLADELVPFEVHKVVAGVKNALSNLPPEATPYLISMHQRIIHGQILCLDPKLQHFESSLVSGLKIYLDTNVIMYALFPLDDADKGVGSVLRDLHRVGCALYVSTLTLDELRGQVDAARQHWRRFMAGSEWVRSLIVRGDDRILAYYYDRLRAESRLAWEAFIAKYDEESLSSLLSTEYHITVSDEEVARVSQDERLSVAVQMVRDMKEKRLESLERPWLQPKLVNDAAVDHDAGNMVLMHLLRKKYPANALGSTVWFTTLDKPLLRAHRALLNYFKRPVMRYLSVWGELIAGLVSPDMTSLNPADYVAFLVQSKLGLVASDRDVNVDFLGTIVQAGVPLEVFTPLTVDQAINVLKRLQESKEVQALVDPSAKLSKKAIRDGLVRQITHVIRDRQAVEDRLAEMDDRLSKASEEKGKFERQLLEMRTELNAQKQAKETVEEEKRVAQAKATKDAARMVRGILIAVVVAFAACAAVVYLLLRT